MHKLEIQNSLRNLRRRPALDGRIQPADGALDVLRSGDAGYRGDVQIHLRGHVC